MIWASFEEPFCFGTAGVIRVCACECVECLHGIDEEKPRVGCIAGML